MNNSFLEDTSIDDYITSGVITSPLIPFAFFFESGCADWEYVRIVTNSCFPRYAITWRRQLMFGILNISIIGICGLLGGRNGNLTPNMGS